MLSEEWELFENVSDIRVKRIRVNQGLGVLEIYSNTQCPPLPLFVWFHRPCWKIKGRGARTLDNCLPLKGQRTMTVMT